MGLLWALINDNFFPGRPRFRTEGVPDMTGKVVLVTGGTAGIGKETARVSAMLSLPPGTLDFLTNLSGVANQERQSLDYCP